VTPTQPVRPDALRRWRSAAGIPVTRLAQLAGVSRSTVHRWEQRRLFPGPAQLRTLATALQVPVVELAAFFDAGRAPGVPPRGVAAPGLRRLRRQRGLTGVGLGRLLGVPAHRVYNWERGACRLPSRELPALAAALGLPVDDVRDRLARPPAGPTARPTTTPLARFRRERGLTQVDAARLLGVGRATLRSWERGNPPPLGHLRRLAAAYGVTVGAVAIASGVRAPVELHVEHWSAGDLPQVVRVLRRWSHLSQRELAQRCGVSVSTLRNWEHGRHEPAGSQRRRLETVLRLPPDSLLRAYRAAAPTPIRWSSQPARSHDHEGSVTL
jgi:transcriptional regulator with XRE-family HTH domain